MSPNPQFTPPPGSDIIDAPRTLRDFLKTFLVVYLPAAVTYAHLLHLQSSLPPTRAEILKFCAFLFFPALPFVQLLNNTVKAWAGDWGDAGRLYYISAIMGMRARLDHHEGQAPSNQSLHLYDVPPHILEPRQTDRGRTIRGLHVVGALILAAPVAIDFAEYTIRLGDVFGGYKDAAALGLDHRIGWMDCGALCATIMTLVVVLLNRQWKVGRIADWGRFNFPVDVDKLQRKRAHDILLEASIAAFFQDWLLLLTNQLSPLLFLREWVGQKEGVALVLGLVIIALIVQNLHRDVELGIEIRRFLFP